GRRGRCARFIQGGGVPGRTFGGHPLGEALALRGGLVTPLAHCGRLGGFDNVSTRPTTTTQPPSPLRPPSFGPRPGRGAATGAPTGLPKASFGSGSPGSTANVSAATGSTTPAPTRLSLPRAGLCAVSVIRRIT